MSIIVSRVWYLLACASRITGCVTEGKQSWRVNRKMAEIKKTQEGKESKMKLSQIWIETCIWSNAYMAKYRLVDGRVVNNRDNPEFFRGEK